MRPFHVDGWVMLPDHLRGIESLSAGGEDLPTCWRGIKTLLTKRISKSERRSKNREKRSERGLWQRRYLEHAIHDAQDYTVRMEYFHFNPAKHGDVAQVDEWPYSTFRQCAVHGSTSARGSRACVQETRVLD